MFLKAQRRRVAGLAVMALVAAGCGSSTGGGSADAETLVVYTGQSGDYQVNFNPFSPTLIDGPGTIFEPLFFFNNLRGDAAPKPRLGKSFSWNADGTELSVEVRGDAKWTDGQAFTAKDVAFTLDMITKNKTMNTTGFKGKATAVDDTHVSIRFDEPAYMEGPQVLGKIYIVPEHLWKDIATPATDPVKNPVGTGPFLLDEFKAQAFTLKSNPGYYGGEPAVKKVRYLSLSGNQAGADALKAGQVDWQTGPVPDIKDVEKNYPGYKATITPMNQTALFTCSNAQLGCTGAQTDPAVRKAVYYGINRTQVNALAFENTSSEVSPGFAMVERDKSLLSAKLKEKTAPMSPDVAKATSLLEGAGYTKGGDGVFAKDGKPLELTVKVVAGWTDYITAVDTIGQQLQQVGIKLTPQQLSWNEWSDARGRGQYELLIDSVQQGPAPDPYYTYSYFFAGANTAPAGEVANPNFGRIKDQAVDDALAALKRIDPKDTAARQPHFDVIQSRVEEVMPYIPVLTGGTTSEYNAKKFTGWPTAEDLYAFPAVWSRPENSEVYLHLKPAGK
ncbi:ABC transporter substrate-binding protein [Umezawaea tangerina]|uniref:Peptide/nickel transport system substrate-binding protein n=1 Tax=Umezawaea tangerina TaxID=84725 RepID=A0A2T0SZH0_9PSEU|nr:ABC transporter substrate-binding protein [Umezawaea tangerina]PRY38753.1 peptide/nickel transport system substrate-binding protein [Umezawaea tangerina]